MSTTSDQEFDGLAALEVELDTLWESDPRGRLTVVRDASRAPAPYAAIAARRGGYAARCGASLPDALAAHIAELIARAAPEPEAGRAPAVVRTCLALLDDALGPWAIATCAGAVVGIYHSARLTGRGAEAGVWTHPAHRGLGHAAAATAAWAAPVNTPDRFVFSSASEGNQSSQRVAARLGRLWTLSAAAPV